MTDIAIDHWSNVKKALFRFAFAYFGLYIIIENNGAYPFWELVSQPLANSLHIFIPWVGKNILHLPYEIKVFTNGSGDTTYDYVIVLTIFATAILSTIVWSLLDRHRENYNKLYYYLTLGVRFYVGLMLINYGLYKVFKAQFPDPGLYRLTSTYGNSSPMGLAWTFLGFSKGYNFFMGFAEIAAVLLLFRRTMTLGLIITLMTTANVMAVNYFFDVPVKLLSTHLVLMTLFLLAKDMPVMCRFFFKGEQVSLAVIPTPVFSNKWIRPAGIGFKILLIAFVTVFGAYQIWGFQKQYAAFDKGEFNGYYLVKSFLSKSETQADRQWKRMNVNNNFARVTMMNDSSVNLTISKDSANSILWFRHDSDTTLWYDFKHSAPDSSTFLLKGKNKTDSVTISFEKYRDFRKKFRLTRTGFHWINEYPNNR